MDSESGGEQLIRVSNNKMYLKLHGFHGQQGMLKYADWITYNQHR